MIKAATGVPGATPVYEMSPVLADGLVQVRLAGDWRLAEQLPSVLEAHRAVALQAGVRRVSFDTAELGAWDSSLLTFLARLERLCADDQIVLDRGGLPQGVQRLLELATAVPDARTQDVRRPKGPSWHGSAGRRRR